MRTENSALAPTRSLARSLARSPAHHR